MGTTMRFGAAIGGVSVLLMACSAPATSPSPTETAPAATSAATAAPSLEPGQLGPGPSVTIEMVGQSGPELLQYTLVEKPYVEETLLPASNGRITVNLATRDERGLAGEDIVNYLAGGQADIASFAFSFASGDFPLLDAPDLAGLNPTAEAATEAGTAWIPTVNEELAGQGVTYLYAFPYPAQVVYCREPFTSFAELGGRSIRTFGVTLNDFVEVVGGQPVSIAFPEVYSALERGVVDCGITGTATGNANNWFEVTTTYLYLPLTWGLTVYAVNTEWWDGLDPEVRDFVDFHLQAVNQQQVDLATQITDDGRFCNQGLSDECELGTLAPADNAMTEVEPTEADQQALADGLREIVIPAWIDRCGEERCRDLFNEVLGPVTGVEVP